MNEVTLKTTNPALILAVIERAGQVALPDRARLYRALAGIIDISAYRENLLSMADYAERLHNMQNELRWAYRKRQDNKPNE